MKRNLHPKCHNIKVKMVSGEVFETSSVWNKPNEPLVLEIDAASHPAWSDKRFSMRVSSKGQVQKFKQRFAAFTDLQK